MKKIGFIIIAFVTLASCSKGIPAINDVEKNNLRGKVKRMVEVINNEKAFPLHLKDSVIYSFNEKGYLTEVVQHSKIGIEGEGPSYSSITTYYTYNPEGMSSITYNNNTGDVMEQVTEKYTPEGLVLTKVINDKDNGRTTTLQHTYNHDKREVEAISKTSGIDKTERGVLEYNKQGRIIKGTYYIPPSKEPTVKSNTFYNSKDYIERREYYYALTENKQVDTYEYKYDSQGSATEIKEYIDGVLKSTTKRVIEYY